MPQGSFVSWAHVNRPLKVRCKVIQNQLKSEQWLSKAKTSGHAGDRRPILSKNALI